LSSTTSRDVIATWERLAYNHETISLAHLFENGKESVAGARSAQERQSAIAGTGDKVQVMRAVGAMQAAGHEKSSRKILWYRQRRARPCKKRKDGAPRSFETGNGKTTRMGHLSCSLVPYRDESMRPYLMKLTLMLLMVVIFAAVSASGAQSGASHDGYWWFSASSDEQQSYELGYGDCYVDSLKMKRPPYVEDRKFTQLISESYRSGTAQSSELVSTVMKRVWAANAGKEFAPPPRGGETWSKPHGYFDGLWWKGASNAEKLGFVEGEIDCFNGEAASRFRVPLSATEYVRWLDKAYGLDEGSSISRSPDDAKIADVLLKKGERRIK